MTPALVALNPLSTPNVVFVGLQDLLVAGLEIFTQCWSMGRYRPFTVRCQGLYCFDRNNLC